MVSDRVREGLANRDQSPAPVIIDATGENDIAIGNPVGLKYVAARGAFFKETVTGVPKLQGAGAVKIQEIAGQIRGGAIPRYVNQSALQNLGKRIVEVAQRVNEQGIVSFAINEWLESYNVSSGCNGRVVAIPEERRLNWYAFEGSVGVNALKNKAVDLDITVIESQSGAVINEEGRYWICVGPRVLDAEYDADKNLLLQFVNNEIPLIENREKKIHILYLEELLKEYTSRTEASGYYILDITGDGKKDFCVVIQPLIFIFTYDENTKFFQLWAVERSQQIPLENRQMFSCDVHTQTIWTHYFMDQNGEMIYSVSYQAEPYDYMESEGSWQVNYSITTEKQGEVTTEQVSQHEVLY